MKRLQMANTVIILALMNVPPIQDRSPEVWCLFNNSFQSVLFFLFCFSDVVLIFASHLMPHNINSLSIIKELIPGVH